MKKLFVAFFLLFIYCLSVRSEKQYEDIDWGLLSGVAETGSSVDRIPGKNSYYRQTGSKSRRGRKSANYSEYYFPSSGEANLQFCRLENNSESKINMSKYDCDENPYLTFYYPSFSAYIEGNSRLFGHSVKVKDVWLNADLEWKLSDNILSSSRLWKSAAKYVSSVNDLSSHLTKNQYQLSHRYTFPKRSAQLDISSLLNDILRERSVKRYFDEKGYVDIKFRYVFHIEVQRKTNGNVCGYFCPNSSCYLNLRVTKSEIGELYVDKGSSSYLDNPMANVVVKGQNNKITFRSNGLSNESSMPIYDVISADGVEIERLETNGTNAIDLAAICEEKNIREGSHISVKRVMGTQHESNSVDFVYLPMPSLVMENSESRVMTNCSKGDDDPAFSYGRARDAYENMPSSFFELPCPKCDFGKFAEYKDSFNIQYRWRYWSDYNGFKSVLSVESANHYMSHGIVAYDFDGDGEKMYIPQSTLLGGRTYYFECVAVMTNFDNLEIPCVDWQGNPFFYEVKTYRYLTQDMFKFSLTPEQCCMGGSVEEARLNVSFVGDSREYGDVYYEGQWNDSIWTSYSGLSVSQYIPSVEKTNVFNVSVHGNCGQPILFSDSITPVKVDHVSPSSVYAKKKNIHVSSMYDEEFGDSIVLVQGMKDSLVSFGVKGNRYSYDFYISSSKDGSDWQSLSSFEMNMKDDTLYLFQKEINKLQCTSTLLTVVLKEFSGKLDAGKFEKDTIWICPNEYLSELPNLTDPSMVGVSHFSYKWMYSYDGIDWRYLCAPNGSTTYEVMTTKDFLDTGKELVRDKMLLRREVFACIDDVEITSDYSSVLCVIAYRQPSFEIDVNGMKNNFNVCTGDTLSVSVTEYMEDAYEEGDAPSVGALGYGKIIVGKGNHGDFIDTLDAHFPWNEGSKFLWNYGEGSYSIRMSADFCGKELVSDYVYFNTPEVPELKTYVGACRVVGQSVEVSANLSTYSYDYYFVKDTIREQYRTSLFIPQKADLEYQVLVNDLKNGCFYQFDEVIPEEDIEEKIIPSSMRLVGDTSSKHLCRGGRIVLTTDGETDSLFNQPYWNYRYKKNNGATETVFGTVKDTFSFDCYYDSTIVFRTYMRYQGTNLCYTVVDSMLLTLWPQIQSPTLDLSDTLLCHGEGLDVMVNGLGGGTSSSYRVWLDSKSEVLPLFAKEGEEVIFHLDSLPDGMNNLSVVAEDSVCPNYYYRKTSLVKKVKVAQNMAFDLELNPSSFFTIDFDADEVFLYVYSSAPYSDTFVLNCGTQHVVKYPGSFKLPIKPSDFNEDGKILLDVTKIASGTYGKCSFRCDTAVYLLPGFNKAPTIHCGDYVGGDTILFCPSESFMLTMDDDVTLNGQPVSEMSGFRLVWENGDGDVVHLDTFLFNPSKNVEKYFAKIYFYDANSVKREVYSQPITFVKRGTASFDSISFSETSLEELMYCVNSLDTVSLVAHFEGDLVWQMKPDRLSWIDVPDSICVKGSTSHANELFIMANSLGNVSTQFRIRRTNICGIDEYSENNLKINFGRPQSTGGIVRSSNIFDEPEQIPDSLVVEINKIHGDTCFFFDSKGNALVPTPLGNAYYGMKVDDLHFGDNVITSVRGEYVTSGELCMSEPSNIKYKIYEKIKKPIVTSSYKGEWLCPGDTSIMTFSVDTVLGGTGRYVIYWEWKYPGDEYWRSWSSFYEEYFHFSLNYDSIHGYKSIELSRVQQPILLLAYVKDLDSQYPGGYALSDSIAINVYPKLKDNGFECLNRYCYGTQLDTIKGFGALGSNRYKYTWYSHEGDEDDPYELMEGDVDEYGSFIFPSPFRLETSVYYKRVVEDLLCHGSASTEKYYNVVPNINLTESSIDCDKNILTGNSPKFYAIYESWYYQNDPRVMLWLDEEKNVIGQSRRTEGFISNPLIVPEDEDSMTVTFYARCTFNGCQSEEDLKFEVNVYNEKKGVLSFENETLANRNPYWICSGGDLGRILSKGESPNVQFLWRYQASGHGLNIMYYGANEQVKSAGVDLDSLLHLPNQNSTGGRSCLNLIRIAYVKHGGETLYFDDDTLRVWIVPTLSSVETELLGRGGYLGGELTIDGNKTKYCRDESVNSVSGTLSDELMDIWSNYKSYMGPSLYEENGAYGLVSYIEENGNESVGVFRHDSCDMLTSHYAGEKPFIPNSGNPLTSRMSICRVVSDGCSSVSTRQLYVDLGMYPFSQDEDVRIIGYKPEETNYSNANAFYEGFEVGDQLKFRFYTPSNQIVSLYNDEACTDTIGDPYIIDYRDGVNSSLPVVYCKLYDPELDCYSEVSSIQIPFALKSDGGLISVSDSVKFFASDSFPEIVSERDAKGTWVVPERKNMEWTYTWQYSYSNKSNYWNDLKDSPSTSSLPKDFVNSVSVPNALGTPYVYFRRVATNSDGRSFYSNVITLSYVEQPSIAQERFRLSGDTDCVMYLTR